MKSPFHRKCAFLLKIFLKQSIIEEAALLSRDNSLSVKIETEI